MRRGSAEARLCFDHQLRTVHENKVLLSGYFALYSPQLSQIHRSHAMTTKRRRLITDSYRVVKKERRGGKRERSPTPPPTQEQIENAARQEDLEKLKQFDLDWRFGPCTGIGRLQRWERAKIHGLNPPEEIKELLLQTPNDPDYNLSLWRDYPL